MTHHILIIGGCIESASYGNRLNDLYYRKVQKHFKDTLGVQFKLTLVRNDDNYEIPDTVTHVIYRVRSLQLCESVKPFPFLNNFGSTGSLFNYVLAILSGRVSRVIEKEIHKIYGILHMPQSVKIILPFSNRNMFTKYICKKFNNTKFRYGLFVNIHDIVQSEPATVDGFHLNAYGHTILADEIIKIFSI